MDVECLKELVDYDAESGLFTAKVKLSSRAKPGCVMGSVDKRGYRQIRLKGKSYYAHRLAFLFMTGAFPAGPIDHKSGRKDDNSWRNLRLTTAALNMQNQYGPNRRNLSKLLGVRSHKGRFQAKINVDGVSTHLGTFATADEAHSKYLEAKRLLHPFGEVAK